MKGGIGGSLMSQMGFFMRIKSQLFRRPSGINDREITLIFSEVHIRVAQIGQGEKGTC